MLPSARNPVRFPTDLMHIQIIIMNDLGIVARIVDEGEEGTTRASSGSLGVEDGR